MKEGSALSLLPDWSYYTRVIGSQPMVDPSSQLCDNPECPAGGEVGVDGVHGQKDGRLKCQGLWHDLRSHQGQPFYRLHKAADLMVGVLTILCHGGPAQTIVAAFGLAERAVADWQVRGGQHYQQIHEHIVGQGKVDLRQVQADEIWVKAELSDTTAYLGSAEGSRSRTRAPSASGSSMTTVQWGGTHG